MTAGFPSAIRISSMASTKSMKAIVSWPRGSDRPPRRPATENDWQGVPPTRMSGAGISRARTIAGRRVISPWLGICGNLWARTSDAARSTSANQSASQPSGFHATEAASIPEHTEPNVKFCTDNHLLVDSPATVPQPGNPSELSRADRRRQPCWPAQPRPNQPLHHRLPHRRPTAHPHASHHRDVRHARRI